MSVLNIKFVWKRGRELKEFPLLLLHLAFITIIIFLHKFDSSEKTETRAHKHGHKMTTTV